METQEKTITRNNRKERTGIVVNNKMDKTAIIAVERRIKHPIYKKYVKKTSKYTLHDEKNECNIGDFVKIVETRPLSKKKRWRLTQILERAK
jgi:small subunit ribosomal protein S17